VHWPPALLQGQPHPRGVHFAWLSAKAWALELLLELLLHLLLQMWDPVPRLGMLTGPQPLQ